MTVLNRPGTEIDSARYGVIVISVHHEIGTESFRCLGRGTQFIIGELVEVER